MVSSTGLVNATESVSASNSFSSFTPEMNMELDPSVVLTEQGVLDLSNAMMQDDVMSNTLSPREQEVLNYNHNAVEVSANLASVKDLEQSNVCKVCTADSDNKTVCLDVNLLLLIANDETPLAS